MCVQGLGTDEETLAEILSTRSGKQLQSISAAYKESKSKIFYDTFFFFNDQKDCLFNIRCLNPNPSFSFCSSCFSV